MSTGRKFKRVLKDNDLQILDTVKEYLEFSFKKRKSKKDYKLYINICKIYNLYPDTIKELLDNIPKLGYYKDYFYILMFSRNASLNDYIYDLVIRQLNEDLDHLDEGKGISTIGKWLPRESSEINKRCNFIDTFNSKFYPNTAQFSARRRYRKLKTMLNKELGTLEAKLCTQQYHEIDFKKVSHMALKRNKTSIMNNEESKVKFEIYETQQLKKMSLSEFIREAITVDHCIDKLQPIWDNNRYCMEIPYINKMISNSACILDLSNETFMDNSHYFAFGVALLIDQYSTLENKVFVCNNNVIKLTGSLKDKLNQLMKWCGPCKPINIGKYHELVTKNNNNISCKNMIFVTSKTIDNLEWLHDKNMTCIQYQPYYEGYDIIHYNGDSIKKFKKHTTKQYGDSQMQIYENKTKNIHNIMVTSNELNDRMTPILILIMLFFIWSSLKCYEIFNF